MILRFFPFPFLGYAPCRNVLRKYRGIRKVRGFTRIKRREPAEPRFQSETFFGVRTPVPVRGFSRFS